MILLYILLGLAVWYIIGCISMYYAGKHGCDPAGGVTTWGDVFQWGVLGIIATVCVFCTLYDECDETKDTHLIAKLKKFLTSSVRSK